MSDSAYKAVLDYLYRQLPMFQRQGASAFKKDLTNITKLCDALGNPQDKFTSIHIAGTNGKGTTTHILSSIFQAAGYKVGVYTSPHYLDLRERIKINNQLMPKEAVIDFVQRIKKDLTEIQPSFFEMMVAMAFEYFAEQKVDIGIIETGLGGRLDSTNIIKPALSVITNISYDHQDMLGETLPEIASEKAGIIKASTPVVIGQTQDEIIEVFTEKARQLNTGISFADQVWSYSIKEENIDSYILNISHAGKVIYNDAKVDLKGEVMLKNMLTALGTVEAWNSNNSPISKEQIINGLSEIKRRTYFLGRMQILQHNPLMLADSAHNEDGLRHLFQAIQKVDFRDLYIVFGMVSDKPLSKIIDQLPKKARYIAVQADIPRAKSAATLHRELLDAEFDVQLGGSVNKGKSIALREAKQNDLILICGSIFVVAEVNEIALD